MNALLYGHSDVGHIVAVHQLNDSSVRVYRRESGKVSYHDAEFFPFFFLSEERFLDGLNRQFWLKKLEGNNFYRHLAAFSRWSDMWDAVRHALREYNKSAPRRAEHYGEAEAMLLKPDPVMQYLMQSGSTYFKDMSFDDVYRLQLDIETYSKDHRFSNARRTEDRIIAIALSDNRGWEHVLDGTSLNERDMLERLVLLIQEKDPDVIEGHNILFFDFPYILKRCELHGVDFSIGRDFTPPRVGGMRVGSGEQEYESVFLEINGRSVIDTMLLAQAYDVSARTLEGYGLKYLAEHFGFSAPDRVHIPGPRISWFWDHEPDTLLRYALDDVRETRLLSEHLLPSYFYLAQICPMPFSAVARGGSSAKIESLLLREYLRQRHSVPKPQPGTQTTGGYSDIFVTGVLPDVVHADVESLYPSIIISKGIRPRSDELGIFPTLLTDLAAMRLKAKRQMQRSRNPLTKSKYDALQSSYKILINSFYGYLGYSRALFADAEQADVVTSTGQELLRHIIHQVELFNGEVVEVDTDGLFFVPPDNVKGEEAEVAFVERLSDSLPKGIVLAYSGRYKKMLSYKKKNYALLDHHDRITIKGSALTSRSMEPFLRSYVRQCIECLLREDFDALHRLYVALATDISAHRLDVHAFARRETLHDSWEAYEKGVKDGTRKQSAVYEAIRRAEVVMKPGDVVSYYITGTSAGVRLMDHSRLAEEWDPNFPDENTAYYLSRLAETSARFEVFFEPADYKRIFSLDDLFGFSSSGVRMVTRRLRLQESPPLPDESQEFGIWLDLEEGR
jgi:DNA polymerase I